MPAAFWCRGLSDHKSEFDTTQHMSYKFSNMSMYVIGFNHRGQLDGRRGEAPATVGCPEGLCKAHSTPPGG